jgi:adenylyl-sulfate kinase
MASDNIRAETSHVGAAERRELLGHGPAVVWLTGLSGSGKSTIAYTLERALIDRRCAAFVLDGDNIRHGLSGDLGFSPDDRNENIRRVGEVAALLADAGLIAISAFISPYAADRARARETAGAARFVECYLDVGVDVCERRDPKGLYARARSGEIAQFTGVSAPYEVPETADLRIDTDALAVDACVAAIIEHLEQRGVL